MFTARLGFPAATPPRGPVPRPRCPPYVITTCCKCFPLFEAQVKCSFLCEGLLDRSQTFLSFQIPDLKGNRRKMGAATLFNALLSSQVFAWMGCRARGHPYEQTSILSRSSQVERKNPAEATGRPAFMQVIPETQVLFLSFI